MPEIIVIGSGVIGLSSARCLQDAGYNVRILTREMPLNTTSVAAGAVWSGSALEGRSRDWAAASLRYFLPLTGQPGSGVTLQRMREVYAEALPNPWYADLLPAFSRVPARDLPAGLVDGYLMDVPMIAPPIYLQALHDQFLAAGGFIDERVVDSLDAVAAEADLLVNCSGVGARQLADDAAVYPMRGQTMLIDAPDIALGYMDNERIDHIFPRADGVLIGGVKLDGDWRRELDPAISADIVRRTSAIESSIAGAKARREFTGLRPGRHQARLELERHADARRSSTITGMAALVIRCPGAARRRSPPWRESSCDKRVQVAPTILRDRHRLIRSGLLRVRLSNGGAMTRQKISSGTEYEKIAGYSRAVRLGNVVHVSGTTATDGADAVVGVGDSGAQTDFIIRKIEAALQQAGASLKDVVRTRVYLAPGADWEAVARVHGDYFGEIRPANTLLYIHALVGEDYLVEMEAEAIVSGKPST